MNKVALKFLKWHKKTPTNLKVNDVFESLFAFNIQKDFSSVQH